MTMQVPFNRSFLTGDEEKFIQEILVSKKFSGNNEFTKKCQELIQQKFGAKKVLLTPSCTDALEMGALLFNLKPGDEVIMPSYTFSSTANAVCLRGAKPVFVDIRPDTLNIDEEKIEEKITEKTKGIIPVHYGGISAEMNKINEIAKKHNLFVFEDAAQGVNSKYNGQYLGTLGDLGAYSFHETKNYSCGEGGAIIINDEKFVNRAEILWEKGTDRCQVIKGVKDKYSWEDLGSSFLLSDILAAFLYAQLLNKDRIQELRKKVYERYYQELLILEEEGLLQLPKIPPECTPNYHSFFILLKDEQLLDEFLKEMKSFGVNAYIGYVPLHLSTMGKKYGYHEGDFPITEDIFKRIVRLPFYTDMTSEEQESAIDNIKKTLRRFKKRC